jgi:uncharacterized protein YgbK (DUF1537 family)
MVPMADALRLGAVADDLTGATDLALILADEGMAVSVVVGVPEPGEGFGSATAAVVALKSRTIPAPEAVAQSVAAARALLGGGARQIFFKYCSTFDSTDAGNIGPVAEALMDLLGETRTIACPAFPANGRTVYLGHLFVGDRLLSESGMRDHPLTPMRDPDLVRVLGRQTQRQVHLIPHPVVAQGAAVIAAALDGMEGIAIVDALSEADLRAIGAAVGDRALVTGGSGVAIGLAANFDAGARPGGRAWGARDIRHGRSVILAGSCSGATRGQVAAALAAGVPALRIDPADIAAGRLRAADAVAFALGTAGEAPPMVYSSADPAGVEQARAAAGPQAGEMIETFFAEVAAALAAAGFSRFLVAGGETSGAVIGGLGVRRLDVGAKVAPGVPWMRARGRQEGLALLLKSGNFGAPDIFLRAWDHLR